MALLWIDGFEGYGDTDNERVDSEMARRYTANNYLEVKSDGRWGGNWSIQPEYLNCDFKTPSLTTDSTLIVNFAIKWPFAEIYDVHFFSMWSNGTEGMRILMRGDGAIQVQRGTTTLATSMLSLICPQHWHWIEFKVVCDNTTGSYELKVDGNTVLSASGIDTQIGASAYHDQVFFTGVSISTGKTPRFDDLIIMDGTGSSYNNFIGQRKIEAIVPTSDTADIDWTTSGGSTHYVLVDDLDPDDDTNYVEDTLSANEDIWGYSDLSGITSVDALCLITDVRVTDATSYDLKTTIKSGGTKYTSTADTISSTSYAMKDRLTVVDPDTSIAWTASGINSIELGVEVG